MIIQGTQRNQQGVALVTVLWVVVLMTVIAASFSLSMRREINVTRNLNESVQAAYFAEAGVNYALLHLLNKNSPQRWQADGSVYEFEIDGTRIRAVAWDEAGKVDINAAPEELLNGLFRVVGVPEDQRPSLVDAVLDWRDADDLTRMHGAEVGDYEAAGLSYGPTDGPFTVTEDLQRVLGMTPEVYDRLAPFITVYSGRAGIDPAVAPKEVLLAIPGVTAAQVANYLASRSEFAQAGAAPPPFPAQASTYLSAGGGVTYSMAAQARLSAGTEAGIEATVTYMSSIPTKPLSVLSWKRAGSAYDLFARELPSE